MNDNERKIGDNEYTPFEPGIIGFDLTPFCRQYPEHREVLVRMTADWAISSIESCLHHADWCEEYGHELQTRRVGMLRGLLRKGETLEDCNHRRIEKMRKSMIQAACWLGAKAELIAILETVEPVKAVRASLELVQGPSGMFGIDPA